MLELRFQGGSIELDEEQESFTKVRHRINKAEKELVDLQNGDLDEDNDFQPVHDLTFFTEEGGRFGIRLEKVIGVYSSHRKDADAKE